MSCNVLLQDCTRHTVALGPHKSIGAFLYAPHPEPAPQGSSNRRLTVDSDFVAHTADEAAIFDGDSFSWSFRMDAPPMPKTGDF
jgi:hypothetical protein